MSHINLIAAVDKKLVIGKDNDLVWTGMPGDMARFKNLTMGHPVITGRKNFESILKYLKKPLPGRLNIIVTRNPDYTIPGFPECIICSSLEEAIKIASEKDGEIFVIGGGEIYKQAMPLADRLYLTVVDAEADGNVFFPDYSEFKKNVVPPEEMPATEKFPHMYRFLTLER